MGNLRFGLYAKQIKNTGYEIRLNYTLLTNKMYHVFINKKVGCTSIITNR